MQTTATNHRPHQLTLRRNNVLDALQELDGDPFATTEVREM